MVELLTVLPEVIWEEPRRHHSRQRMDSPAACAKCAMPTADESNHAAAGTLHPHHTDPLFQKRLEIESRF